MVEPPVDVEGVLLVGVEYAASIGVKGVGESVVHETREEEGDADEFEIALFFVDGFVVVSGGRLAKQLLCDLDLLFVDWQLVCVRTVGGRCLWAFHYNERAIKS